MDIWCAAGQGEGSSLADLMGNAADAGCALVRRDLPDGPGGAGDGHADGPILIWQEQDDSGARTRAFVAGVDEIVGPWMDPQEALARLMRLARSRPRQDMRMVLGELDIDLVDHSARRGDRPLDLLRREYELLVHLARHCGRVQSREALLRAIWRLGFDPGTNVVQVHVSRLRAKLDRGFAQPMLHTVRGAGYCLVAGG
ncbi:MAG TPA: response regulator transcription factor [Sphingobium sp.]